MRLTLFNQKAANIFAENKLLKFAFVVLLMVSMINYQATQQAMDSTKTIILPVNASGDLWVSAHDASDAYLRQMARYLTSMLANYTAASARAQFEELLILFSPATFAGYQTAFDKIATDIERFATVSSRITWIGNTPLRLSQDRKKITVRAKKDRLVNGEVTRSTEVEIRITFYIEDGRLWIHDLTELSVNAEEGQP